MGTYSDSPSMDEILKRIKNALRERDGGGETGAAATFERSAGSSASASQDGGVNYREYARKPEVRARILDGFVADFASDLSVRPLRRPDEISPIPALLKETREPDPDAEMPPEPEPANEPPSMETGPDGTFLLTRKMRVVRRPDLSGVDLDLFYRTLATELSVAMGISYMTDKIERWLRENTAQVAKRS